MNIDEIKKRVAELPDDAIIAINPQIIGADPDIPERMTEGWSPDVQPDTVERVIKIALPFRIEDYFYKHGERLRLPDEIPGTVMIAIEEFVEAETERLAAEFAYDVGRICIQSRSNKMHEMLVDLQKKWGGK